MQKDRPMSCGTEERSQTPCCCPGKCDYYEVARKTSIAGGNKLVSQMVEVNDANVLEVDAQDWSPGTTVTRVGVAVQFGNDAINWTQVDLTPVMFFNAPGSKSGVLTGFSAKYARLVFTSAGRTTRLSAGIRLRTEVPALIKADGPILPGLEEAEPGVERDYFLLADRLFVALGSSVTLAPVSMADRNAVQLEIVVVQPAGLPISASVEGSDDTQNWETLASYSGLAFGYNAPSALTSVTHRFVRARVSGPQALSDGIVELGMSLSKR